MFNFTKKDSNAPVDINQQAAGASEEHDAAIKKIERLEAELIQKTHELNESYKTQAAINENIKICTASLYTIRNQLQAAATHIDRSNKHILDLMQKNRVLKLSGNEWLKRAIKLEFEVLTAKDELKKIAIERDLSIKMCELLQADKENSQDGTQH